MAIDTTRPRLFIPGPQPQQLPFGLLTVANEVTPGDVHAQLGVQYETLTGLSGALAGLDSLSGLIGSLSPTESFDSSTPAGAFPTVYTNPFLAYAGVQAHPVGHTPEELQARASAKLALAAGYLAEKALWAGTPSSNDHLNMAGATDLTPTAGTATNIDLGIGLLENWIGSHVGAQGSIHASRILGGSLWNQVHTSGAKMLTTLGTPVAFGAGYDGTGPSGTTKATPDAGTTWLYATGPVTVVRSEVGYTHVPGAQATSYANQAVLTTVYATEILSVGFEGGVAAVLVQLT